MLGTVASKELKMCDSTERLYHTVITDSQGTILCGGSLISDSWILTDVYCYQWWERENSSTVLNKCFCSAQHHRGIFYILYTDYLWSWLVRGMKIILGGHPGPGRTIVIDNPPVIRKNSAGFSDLMLLKLPTPTKIEPVKLPTCPLPA